jgi:DNA-binding XRE family transcriptional regulator
VSVWQPAQCQNGPEYIAACDALEEEFALASTLIEARARAGLTQEEVARPMGANRAAVARLERAAGASPRPAPRSASPRPLAPACASASGPRRRGRDGDRRGTG